MNSAVHPIHLGLSVAFLIEGEAGLILVDAGMPGSERLIWAWMGARGFRREDLRLIVLTHAHIDHCGCVPDLLQGSGAVLAAHPLAAERLQGEVLSLPPARRFRGKATVILFRLARPWLANPRLEVDLPLEDGASLEEWGLPAKVLHTPGHTADSLTLLTEDGSAFVGDLLIGRGRWAYPQPYFIEDEEALSASMVRLRRERPLVFYVAHSTRALKSAW